MVNGLILSTMDVIAIKTQLGENVIIKDLPRYQLQTLAANGIIDTLIVDSEDGFSQLGMMRRFLSGDLGLQERNIVKYFLDGCPKTLERNISSLADWNVNEAQDVTLISIPSCRRDSLLKGAILAPGEDCRCYSKYAIPEHGKPYRDFFYNVTYEAISYAYKVWGAKNIGMANLESYRRIKYGEDIAKCQIEAIVHFCNENTGIESFTLLGDYWGQDSLEVVWEFSNMENVGSHRAINTRVEEKMGIDFTYISWDGDANGLGTAQKCATL